MTAPRTAEIRDKYTGEVIGEVAQDTRRDLRAKIHRAFQAKEAVRETSFQERAELGRRIGRRLAERRAEFEELMIREAGQPRKFARWEMETLGECMLHVGGRMKKYVPELAGNDPFVVLESADLPQACAAGLLGGYAHSGQLCIAAKRFLVQRPVAADFRERLVDGIGRLKVGDPSEEETDIGPIGKHESLDIAEYQVREALERGGRFLIGGKADGPFFHPTLIEFEKAQILGAREEEKPFLWIEESFAPVRSFVVFDTLEEAVALANDGPYGLGASVFGETEQAAAIGRRLAAGRIMINEGPLYSDISLPIGGIRDSGLYGSTDKIEELAYTKRIHLAT